MPNHFSKIKYPFLFAFFILFAAILQAQTNLETKIPVKHIGWKAQNCFVRADNQVIDKTTFREITAREDCSSLNDSDIDFAKQTLLTYRVGGDCHMRVRTDVFRNDSDKNFVVRIRNYWGRCRSGKIYRGWILLDKIPEGYKVLFREEKIDKWDNSDLSEDIFDFSPTKKSKNLPTREFKMNGCVQMYRQKDYVIKSDEEFKEAIRNDASREYCLENLEKIDFGKNSLLGIDINSGYCRRPVGLEYQFLKNENDKKYILKIGFIEPGEPCRAYSSYHLWILVPKIQNNFDVEFEVKAISENLNK